MFTGIGIIIILKQIPHFFGYDSSPEGDFAFFQVNGENTFSEIFNAINFISPGATLIAVIGIVILVLWKTVLSKKGKFFTLIQGPLVAVVAGIFYFLVTQCNSFWSISEDHLVSVPVPLQFQLKDR